jgi:hypothetical protein
MPLAVSVTPFAILPSGMLSRRTRRIDVKDLERAFLAAKLDGAEALDVLAFNANRRRIVDLAARSRLPAIYESRELRRATADDLSRPGYGCTGWWSVVGSRKRVAADDSGPARCPPGVTHEALVVHPGLAAFLLRHRCALLTALRAVPNIHARAAAHVRPGASRAASQIWKHITWN